MYGDVSFLNFFEYLDLGQTRRALMRLKKEHDGMSIHPMKHQVAWE